MDQEMDTIVFTDDEGNDVTVQVLSYFYYNGEEYAVLADADAVQECECPPEGECECPPTEIFFMKVVPVEGSEDEVEFEPIEDEDLADKLFEVISADLDEDN